MAIHQLDNQAWGIETSCFVCERRNPAGLQVRFVHDDDAAEVRADFALGDAFSGIPGYLHGGVVLALLDEAMAWGAICLAGEFAVTTSMTTEFLRAVRVDTAHRVRAVVDHHDGPDLTMSAQVTGPDEVVHARAVAAFRRLEAGSLDVDAGTDALLASGDTGRVSDGSGQEAGD